MLRSLVASAAKGSGPAQRKLIETVQAIERELASLEGTVKNGKSLPSEVKFTSAELARRFDEIVSEALKKKHAQCP